MFKRPYPHHTESGSSALKKYCPCQGQPEVRWYFHALSNDGTARYRCPLRHVTKHRTEQGRVSAVRPHSPKPLTMYARYGKGPDASYLRTR